MAYASRFWVSVVAAARRGVLIAGTAAALGACAADPFSNDDWNPFAKETPAGPAPVAAESLLTAEGTCPEPAADAPLPRGIALEMTECDVVRFAGPVESFEIGAGEDGVRTLVLTYQKGVRPGVYRFVAGRLKVIEELPPPARPQRQQRARPRA